jgi:tRNA(fMet)-specific endonuclease VapC
MRFLLDTNVVSDLVRNPQGKCAARIAQAGESNICTSIIVACELRYGALKRASIRLTRQLETVLSVLDIVPFEAPADSVYAKVRTKLEAAGTPIGGNDLLIASHALALGLVVVTDNEREFDRVDGLKVENWLK